MFDSKDQIVLPGGRKVHREDSGRYRDAVTGRWVAADSVEGANFAPRHDLEEKSNQKLMAQPTLRDFLDRAVKQAAHNQGHPVESLGEAWAKVLQVQAEIALDKQDPAKATAAARLLAKATNFMSGLEPERDEQAPWFILGRELAGEVLDLIWEEQDRRKAGIPEG